MYSHTNQTVKMKIHKKVLRVFLFLTFFTIEDFLNFNMPHYGSLMLGLILAIYIVYFLAPNWARHDKINR